MKFLLQTLNVAMETNTTLKEFDLNDNLIGDLGGQVRAMPACAKDETLLVVLYGQLKYIVAC